MLTTASDITRSLTNQTFCREKKNCSSIYKMVALTVSDLLRSPVTTHFASTKLCSSNSKMAATASDIARSPSDQTQFFFSPHSHPGAFWPVFRFPASWRLPFLFFFYRWSLAPVIFPPYQYHKCFVDLGAACQNNNGCVDQFPPPPSLAGSVQWHRGNVSHVASPAVRA